MKQPIICITGGHLTPAIAVIEEIQQQNLSWELVFIGRSWAFEGGGSPTNEERLVRSLGVAFHALTTGRLERYGSPFTFFALLKVPIGFLQAFVFLIRNRPTMVLSFGGYIALPVVIAATMLNIPVITHEQTDTLGLSNTIIARFARRVILARESGVPLRHALFDPPQEPSFTVDTKPPILYMTGGSTGAQSLNVLVFPIIAELTKMYTVIHQVGASDLSKARRERESLCEDERHRYIVGGYFDLPDVAWIYSHASLLIGRAGANTVAEAAAIGLPALFIPLPWAAGNEQAKNAKKLESIGTAIVLDQETLTPDKLLFHIRTTMQLIGQMRKRARMAAKKYPRDGAAKVVQVLQGVALPCKATPYEK